MIRRHLALIVEDDRTTAEDLAEILKSLECESIIADNKRDALAALQTNAFCFILLDLEIKGDPDSIRGHTEHGNSFLREIRRIHAEHPGLCYWLPVLIVSGFAREVDAAVDVMKDGADDIVHKPFIARDVSTKIRGALERSGRLTHNLCGGKPTPRTSNEDKGVLLAIPGDRIRRRTRVMVGSRPIDLTDSSLRVLLELMVARGVGTGVHKRTLGASDDQGFKGVSVLREALKPVLSDGINIIDNDYHGNYWLTENVRIGSCDTERLEKIGDSRISKLAQKLRLQLKATHPKSEGNF
jgi:DNA-binding response OmpR family regulator